MYLKKTRNSLEIQPLDLEKKWWLNFEKYFPKYQWMTCDYLCYVTLLICLRWRVASFWGVIRNILSAWMIFNARNKGMATELAEKMVIPLVMLIRLLSDSIWLLYYWFIRYKVDLLYIYIYISWLRLAMAYFFWLLKVSQKS